MKFLVLVNQHASPDYVAVSFKISQHDERRFKKIHLLVRKIDYKPER